MVMFGEKLPHTKFPVSPSPVIVWEASDLAPDARGSGGECFRKTAPRQIIRRGRPALVMGSRSPGDGCKALVRGSGGGQSPNPPFLSGSKV